VKVPPNWHSEWTRGAGGIARFFRNLRVQSWSDAAKKERMNRLLRRLSSSIWANTLPQEASTQLLTACSLIRNAFDVDQNMQTSSMVTINYFKFATRGS
jgi:hypothetical protein